MEPEKLYMQGLVLDAVMWCAWKPVPLEQESIWRKRIQAEIRSRKLLPLNKASADKDSDMEQDPILARLDGLEAAMNSLLQLLRFGPKSEPELSKQWLRLGQDSLEIRLGMDDDEPCEVGSVLHVKWVFPHLPDSLQECLAKVVRVYELDSVWKSMVLEYDYLDAAARDEIGRAAFLSQRLSRNSDR